jgi:hypothetical protein
MISNVNSQIMDELSQSEQLALVANILAGNITGGTNASQSSTAGTPIEIQLLLSAIPIVEDGQVIRSEHHNLLRAALVAIAAQLGVTVGGPTGPTDVTLTLLPAFYPGLFSEWKLGIGIAGVAPGNTNTQGWLPVQLPDGALIKSMTVFGRRDANVSIFSVTLERQNITSGDYEEIITANLANSSQTFKVKKTFQGDAGLNEVDNTKYKYLIDAVATKSDSSTDLIQIYAMQVVYSTT